MSEESQLIYKLRIVTFEAEVVWHEEFGGALPAEALARARIELPSDGIELSLRESGISPRVALRS